MAKKVNTKIHGVFRNPLLIPLLLAIVVTAYFVGRNQSIVSDKSLLPTQTITPTISPTTKAETQQNTTLQNRGQERVTIVNAINQKLLYCTTDGAGAVQDINNQLQYEKNRLDTVLTEQNTCNNSCRSKESEILKQCESSSDYEGCIKKCGNDCYATAQKQMEIIKQSLNEKAKTFNEVASKYCTQ